jgi:Tol biopolymer transport system component
MQFLSWLLTELAFGVVITWCTIFSSFGQSSGKQNIIDTASKVTVFAPGIVSTPFEEAAATFTPDGNTVYFYQGTLYTTICFSKMINGKWTKPEVVPFSGQWSDWDPFLSPDGKKLFFVSNRPLEEGASQNKPKKNSHLWYADHLPEDKWSKPNPVNAPFNFDDVSNYAPSLSNSGTLCFFSPSRDKNKRSSYYAKWLGDHYDVPKELSLNGDNEVSDPFIAPDESYIIFVSGNDIYISFRQGDNWAQGQKLEPQVNNGDPIWDPTVSPDGKMLYYTSARVKGFYKREPKAALNYDGLETEMQSIFNGRGNILMIPINLPKTNH